MASEQLKRLAGGALLLGTAAHAAIDQFAAVGNAAALSAWEELTGEHAPELVANADGSTALRWTGGGTLDVYARDASGGPLLTPVSSGAFFALGVQGQWLAAGKDDRSWANISASASNDRSLLPGSTQLNSFQAGLASRDLRVVLGDVPVLHSDLGTSTALRGVGFRQRIDETMLSFAAGVIAPSWEAISHADLRSAPIRNAIALKASHVFTGSSVVFSTLQAFDDGEAVNAAGAPVPESGQSGTIGLALRHGRFALQSEAGIGRRNMHGGAADDGAAALVDGTWTGHRVTLRAGYHDVSSSFATLSASARPGVRESYANAAWALTAHANVAVDVRDTLDRNAAAAPDPQEQLGLETVPQMRSRAVTVQGNLALSRLPGASVSATLSRSRGSSDDGSRNDVDAGSIALSFVRGHWSGTLGYQVSFATLGQAEASGSTLHGWHARGMRSLPGVLPGIDLSVQLQAQVQRQVLAAGNDSQLASVGLRLAARSERWGEVSIGASTAWGHDPAGKPLRQSAASLDATHPLSKQLSVRGYLAVSDNFPDLQDIAYRETVGGVQLAYRF